MSIDIHGWCARFCQQAISGEVPASGADPVDHGLWCRSRMVAVNGLAATGERVGVYAEAVSYYLHGTATEEEVALRNNLFGVVAVSLGDVEHPTFALTPAEARQLAAALTYLADVATGIDAPAPVVTR